MITRPITDDGNVGYDTYGQLCCRTREGSLETHVFIVDVRESKCEICGRGWEPNAQSMADQVRWTTTQEVVHETCLARFVGLTQRQRFQAAFSDLGLPNLGIKKIPNGYHRPEDVWAVPWYSIELKEHPMKITLGWRKRVIEIKVSAQGGKKLDFAAVLERSFAEENVTKHFTDNEILLHAWSYEDLERYLRDIVAIGKLKD